MCLLQYKRAQWLEPEVNCTLVSVLLAFAELKEHFWYCSELAIRQILVFYITKNRCSICELVLKSFVYITLSMVLVSGYNNLIAGLLHTSQLHEALQQKREQHVMSFWRSSQVRIAMLENWKTLSPGLNVQLNPILQSFPVRIVGT